MAATGKEAFALLFRASTRLSQLPAVMPEDSAQRKQWNNDLDQTISKLVASKDLLASRDAKMLKQALTSLQLRFRATHTPDVMDTRLLAGLDLAQRAYERLNGKLPLKPPNLRKWNCMTKPLLPLFSQSSIEETMMDVAEHKTHDTSNQDPFLDMRQTLLHIANACDNDSMAGKKVLMQDKAMTQAAVALRVVDVRTAPSGDPIILVLFSHSNVQQARVAGRLPPMYDWAKNNHENNGGINNIIATVEEQVMMIRLLELNATRLDPTWSPRKEEHESTFKISFIMPTGPLNAAALSKSDKLSACGSCGSSVRISKLCSRCRTETYCSTECQSAHWKQHKSQCKAISTSASFTFPLVQNPYAALMGKMGLDGQDLRWGSVFNRHDSAQDLGKDIKDLNQQANTFGDSLFIAKLQLPMDTRTNTGMANADSMMIYDAKRTFTLHITPGDTPQDFSALIQRVIKFGPRGLKLYAWVQRIGNDKLRVFHEQLPAQDISW